MKSLVPFLLFFKIFLLGSNNVCIVPYSTHFYGLPIQENKREKVQTFRAKLLQWICNEKNEKITILKANNKVYRQMFILKVIKIVAMQYTTVKESDIKCICYGSHV